jgi:hypothetical protein
MATLNGQQTATVPGAVQVMTLTEHGSRCGMAAATSVLQLCLHELDGTLIDRDVAREFARRVIRSYLDQVERVASVRA